MRYDAFISYRHSDLDMFVAKKIHKKLETMKVPRAVTKKTGKKNIKRIFRDQEELPIGSDLGNNIQNALAESEYLIVICSPRTPDSYWVEREIDTFIAMHGRERILAVLIEGEPNESFPKQLLCDDHGAIVEPLAADVRGTSQKEVTKKMKTEIMRLAAPILGCTYDDLRQRHKERRMRKTFWTSVVVAVLAVAFGVYSFVNLSMIRQNYKEKQINQSKYLSDISQSLYSMGDREDAVLVALEALPSKENNRPYVADAQCALAEALNLYATGNNLMKDRLLKHDSVVESMLYNHDGSKLVTIDQVGCVYVWDVETGKLLIKDKADFDEDGELINRQQAFLTQEDNLVIATDKEIISMDLNGNENWHLKNDVTQKEYEVDTVSEMIVCISNNQAILVDATDGTIIESLDNPSPENPFADAVFFKGEGVFAIEHLTSGTGTGMVTVYDSKTKTHTKCITTGASILGQAFTEEGNLIVYSGKNNDFGSIGSGKVTKYVQKIDVTTGTTIWCNQIEVQPEVMLSLHSFVKTAGDVVMLGVGCDVYIWSASDGSVKSTIGLSTPLASLLMTQDATTGFAIEPSGIINFIDITAGEMVYDVKIEIGASIDDVQIVNGVLAGLVSGSESVLLMKYSEGIGLEEITSKNIVIERMVVSENENYYATTDGGMNSFFFYQSKDNTLVGELHLQDDVFVQKYGFVDDSSFYAVDNEGHITFYNIEKEEEEQFAIEKIDYDGGLAVSDNKKFLFVHNIDGYSLIDLEKRELVEKSMWKNKLSNDGVISNDGRWFYGRTKDGYTICLEVKTGEVETLDKETYRPYRLYKPQSSFAISSDGSFLAVNCIDGSIRIYDTKSKETLDTVSFIAEQNCFIRFVNDRLIMQGDNACYSVYDLDEKNIIYSIEEGRYSEIDDVVYNRDEKTLVLITGSDMFILNEEDYAPIARITGGVAYISKYDSVYVQDMRKLYRFPYLDLEEMVEEAHRQFGDATLTENERVRYHIN